jgi:CRP-like cAMP-binding protein
MSPFVQRIHTHITPLSADAQIDIAAHLVQTVFHKGDIINSEGAVCRKLFFIEMGLVKHFYYHNGKRYVIRFFAEDDFFTVLDSFIPQQPADFTTVALEDTTVYYLEYDDVERLAKKHHSFETFLRLLFAGAALHGLRRTKDMFNKDAAALYENFLIQHKHLAQRVSLGDIAGYLGISQVSLSRVRSNR